MASFEVAIRVFIAHRVKTHSLRHTSLPVGLACLRVSSAQGIVE